jgi:hypothetical protein
MQNLTNLQFFVEESISLLVKKMTKHLADIVTYLKTDINS